MRPWFNQTFKYPFLTVAVKRKEKTSKDPQVFVAFVRPDVVVVVPEYQIYFM